MTARGVAERVTAGWDDGFSGATGAALGAAAAAYRGLIETRGWLYARGVLRARTLPCPVVAIGNLTVGGTGKTPAVELAVRMLAELGHRPAVVSRGYGRRSRGVHVVADVASIRLEAEEAGDEPFLLARRLPGVPVVVGAQVGAAEAQVQRGDGPAGTVGGGAQRLADAGLAERLPVGSVAAL
ncbi:MAG TPA: tetraacyldisaccharide 4'-kinase [Terriglobales bacterium]|nr:tetraacyldisaccharide 4'-kinase [Terriglobales bacterium]